MRAQSVYTYDIKFIKEEIVESAFTILNSRRKKTKEARRFSIKLMTVICDYIFPVEILGGLKEKNKAPWHIRNRWETNTAKAIDYKRFETDEQRYRVPL